MNERECVVTYQDVLKFWFEEVEPRQWFVKDAGFDAVLRDRFLSLHQQAVQCELYTWRLHPQGRLAEIIVLDQFSRNLFRNTSQAFASDALALGLAQEAVALGADEALTAVQRGFLYMPYMHSESLAIHQQAVVLYEKNGLADNLQFELKHQDIIRRFGRYPHRNTILGRVSTPEELVFLQQVGSSF